MSSYWSSNLKKKKIGRSLLILYISIKQEITNYLFHEHDSESSGVVQPLNPVQNSRLAAWTRSWQICRHDAMKPRQHGAQSDCVPNILWKPWRQEPRLWEQTGELPRISRARAPQTERNVPVRNHLPCFLVLQFWNLICVHSFLRLNKQLIALA